MRLLVRGAPAGEGFLPALLRGGAVGPGPGLGDVAELKCISSFQPFTEPWCGRGTSLGCKTRSPRAGDVALVGPHSTFLIDLGFKPRALGSLATALSMLWASPSPASFPGGGMSQLGCSAPGPAVGWISPRSNCVLHPHSLQPRSPRPRLLPARPSYAPCPLVKEWSLTPYHQRK